LGLFITFQSFSQTNFKWEKTDSFNKTKDQIYSDTKLFIAQEWKSAKAVIQNDDKDGGIILIKGIYTNYIPYSLGYGWDYVYDYTITFMMKDKKFKIIIDNVICSSAEYNSHKVGAPLIQSFEGNECPRLKLKFAECSPKCEKKLSMMNDIKNNLQKTIDDYMKFIKTSVTGNFAKTFKLLIYVAEKSQV